MTYLVPTKPVLHSSTNIAGAARAANLSKSLAIWRPECPNLRQAARRSRAGRPARIHITAALMMAGCCVARRLSRHGARLSRSPCRSDPGSAAQRYTLHRVRDTEGSSPLFRTGIDDRPEIFAVLDLLHLGGESAIFADPGLHRIRIIRHQIRRTFRACDLDAEGKRLVVIGLVETEAGLRRHADLVHRHDAEHQRAGRIADAVDDHALLAVADARVLRLVFLDIAAVIARDVQVRARRRRGKAEQDNEGKGRDAHGSNGDLPPCRNLGKPVRIPDQAPELWRDCVGIWLSIAPGLIIVPCGHFSAPFWPNPAKMAPKSAKKAWFSAGIPEKSDDPIEAVRRRCHARGLRHRPEPCPGAPSSPLSPGQSAALSDQLPAQLRPGPYPRHVRLLRRPGDQSLLPERRRLHRPGSPPPPLLLSRMLARSGQV